MELSGINVDLGSLGNLAKDIRTAITGKAPIDPTKLAEIDAGLQEIESNLRIAQMKVNEAEAKSASLFVAGWRPFVGWICGLAFGLHFLAFPVVAVILKAIQSGFTLPRFDIQTLVTILFGMLGLGAYRSLEKKWGVQSLH